MSDLPCKFHSLERTTKCLACENATLTQQLTEARAAMEAAGSLPGKDWLIGQLALAEYLDGKGGPHLKYAIEQYEEYKRAAEAGGDRG